TPPPLPALVPIEPELPLTVTPVRVVVPEATNRPPPVVAELPVMLTFVSDRLAALLNRPPPRRALPPLIVSPESAANSPSTSNTWLAPPPLVVSSVAPGPAIVVAGPVSVSGPEVRVIV